jgi:hypothetical protein
MDYALLIYASEARFGQLSQEQQGKLFADYGQYTKDLMATGKAQPGAALEPSHTATSVRVRDGKTLLSDGPFAETKEQLGGFYIFKSDNLDEVVSWASKIPDAVHGTIEIRPLPDMKGAPPYPPTAPKPADAKKEYLLLIYEPESLWVNMSEAKKGEIFGKYFAFSGELRKAGLFVDGAALTPTMASKSVKLREGKRLVSDGPFAETKEQLGGYYRIWAKDLDHAVALSKKIPAIETGTIEIRPVMDTSQFE